VGASGAGKTTLAKLVAGIHSPDTGTIRLGRTPIDALGPAATRRTVALVTQDTHVFAATIADNVRLAQPDATDDDITAAVERVGAHHWITALPDGIHTVVGDGGHPLGPLEAQHLAMARLALHPARIVVLDEATAEAGSAGARTLETAAIAAIGDRTAIVIAHRLTQAVRAHRISVMANGTVIQHGTHHELTHTPGPYAELWQAWTTPRHQP
jgi:ATP-binding cassette subfamily C protein